MTIPVTKLKQVIEALGITPTEFAARHTLPQSVTHTIDAGRDALNIDLIDVLLCHYHVNPQWLFRDGSGMFTYSHLAYSGNARLSQIITDKQVFTDTLKRFFKMYNANNSVLCLVAGTTAAGLEAFINTPEVVITTGIARIWATIGHVYNDPNEVTEVYIFNPED